MIFFRKHFAVLTFLLVAAGSVDGDLQLTDLTNWVRSKPPKGYDQQWNPDQIKNYDSEVSFTKQRHGSLHASSASSFSMTFSQCTTILLKQAFLGVFGDHWIMYDTSVNLSFWA